MALVNDVNPHMLIEKAKAELEKMPEMEMPTWAKFVKTGSHVEREPLRSDWWQVRAAAVLRKVYLMGPIGVSKLRVKYGGRKRRGHKTEKFEIAGGKIIRVVLQQLEKAGFLEQAEAGSHKGRIATPKGISFMDKLAVSIKKDITKSEGAKE